MFHFFNYAILGDRTQSQSSNFFRYPEKAVAKILLMFSLIFWPRAKLEIHHQRN